MGVTREVAALNRERIITAAERLFRQKGVDAVGLTELMKEAGFTQGGFYNHFKSKEALVAEVLKLAVDQGLSQLTDAIATSRSKDIDPLSRQVNWYLSAGQRDDIECGCAMASFAGDVRRLSMDAQTAYADALGRTFTLVAEMVRYQNSKLTTKQAHARAIGVYSQMVGGLMLSRAVAVGDRKLAEEILKHARSGILADLASAAGKVA